jgi:isopentenyl-diphosphate delta-isomerase
MVKLVIVNKKDEEIGLEEKLRAHLGKGVLHRAFTILIFSSKNQLPSGAKVKKNEVLRLLIQKRGKDKFLWPLIWETTCSSHPFQKEDCIKAGEKRLKKELGITCKLKLLTKFQYQAKYKNIGSENEVCTLLVGKYKGRVTPDPKEVADWKLIGIKTLKKDLKKKPGEYAPWLKIALKIYENRK